MHSTVKKTKQEKFSFEKMKEAAMHADPAVRKESFVEYFERFEEFPSYLFNNEATIDKRLFETIQDLLKDPETTHGMRKGLAALMARLLPESAIVP